MIAAEILAALLWARLAVPAVSAAVVSMTSP